MNKEYELLRMIFKRNEYFTIEIDGSDILIEDGVNCKILASLMYRFPLEDFSVYKLMSSVRSYLESIRFIFSYDKNILLLLLEEIELSIMYIRGIKLEAIL